MTQTVGRCFWMASRRVWEIFARQRERTQPAGQEMVSCARVSGNGFASLMTPKPVPRSDGSTPRMTRCALGAARSADAQAGETARGETPPRRSWICSNCRRVMLTSGFCQWCRGCKRKNAGRNLRVTAFGESSKGKVSVPDRCRDHFDCWNSSVPARRHWGATHCVASVLPARRKMRCDDWPRAHCAAPD